MTVTKTYLLVDLQNRQPPFEHVEACIGKTGLVTQRLETRRSLRRRATQ